MNIRPRRWFLLAIKRFAVAWMSCVPLLSTVWADPPGLDLATRQKATQAIQRGTRFLIDSQQQDGGWQAQGRSHVGISGVVTKALGRAQGVGPGHDAVKRAVEFLKTFLHEDGGIYHKPEGHLNYHTSVALMAIVAAGDPTDAKLIEQAQRFLTQLQWDEAEGYDRKSTWYGGAGYGGHRRPDLSNTQMMIEALKESGLPASDPAYQKALVFISRCQMTHKGNDQTFAEDALEGEGGFIYTPVNGGESAAGLETVMGKRRLRAYGSMTYAGFKSMLYAQMDRDDIRIRQAWDWIQANYTLDQNPNMPEDHAKEGLFYFYQVFSKTMLAWGQETITDDRGAVHPWRRELIDKITSQQRSDGSWVNEADRWMEGNPYLVTAYAVIALQDALTEGTVHP